MRPAPAPAVVRPPRRRPRRLTFVSGSAAFAVALALCAWTYIVVAQSWPAHGFLSGETASRAASFLGDLAGAGRESTPAYRDGGAWAEAARLALATLAMSVLAAGMAAAGALLTFMFAARNVMVGELAPHRSPAWGVWLAVIRLAYALSRSVPELIWAMLLVFVLSPGILPGALALALHNFGILGKLSAEVVEGLDARPARALRTSGAGWFQVVAYAVLPAALPRFITYLFYRWEVIIRTTIVVGLVSAGGLGMEFRLAMSHFHYTTVSLLLAWYLLLVLGVDSRVGGDAPPGALGVGSRDVIAGGRRECCR